MHSDVNRHARESTHTNTQQQQQPRDIYKLASWLEHRFRSQLFLPVIGASAHCRSPANAESMPSNSRAVSVFRQPRKSLSAAKSQLFPRRSAGLFAPIIIPI